MSEIFYCFQHTGKQNICFYTELYKCHGPKWTDQRLVGVCDFSPCIFSIITFKFSMPLIFTCFGNIQYSLFFQRKDVFYPPG